MQPMPKEITAYHRLHLAALVLALAVLVVGIIKIAVAGRVYARVDVMAITMSIKTLVVLAYMELSRRPKWQRWESLLANYILSIFEIAFWLVIAYLAGSALSPGCYGKQCGLFNGIVIALAIVQVLIALPAAYIAGHIYYYKKRTGVHPDEKHHSNTLEMGQARTESVDVYKQDFR